MSSPTARIRPGSGFSDEGFYDNFTHSPDQDLMTDQLDPGDATPELESDDDASRLMD